MNQIQKVLERQITRKLQLWIRDSEELFEMGCLRGKGTSRAETSCKNDCTINISRRGV